MFTGWWLAQPSMNDPRRIVRMMGWGVGAADVVSAVIYWTHYVAARQGAVLDLHPGDLLLHRPVLRLLYNLCEPRMRAQFCAATLFIANVGNLIVAPQMVGFLSDAFAPNHVANGESLRLAMMCLVPVGLWSSWHYFRSTRRIVQGQTRATGSRRSSGNGGGWRLVVSAPLVASQQSANDRRSGGDGMAASYTRPVAAQGAAPKNQRQEVTHD